MHVLKRRSFGFAEATPHSLTLVSSLASSTSGFLLQFSLRSTFRVRGPPILIKCVDGDLELATSLLGALIAREWSSIGGPILGNHAISKPSIRDRMA